MSQQDIEQLKDDVATIKRALLGDDNWREKGLLDRVESIEKWRSNVNLKVAFYSGAATTLVMILKAGFEYLTNQH